MNKLTNSDIIEAIHKTPYCTQDGIPNDQKKVIAHYFIATLKPVNGFPKIEITAHWFVLEDSMYDEPSKNFANGFGKVVFGAVDLGMGLELGDFSIEELENLSAVINLDKSFKPLEKTMGELRKQYKIEWMV